MIVSSYDLLLVPGSQPSFQNLRGSKTADTLISLLEIDWYSWYGVSPGISTPLSTAITTAGSGDSSLLSLQYSSCHCQFIDVSPIPYYRPLPTYLYIVSQILSNQSHGVKTFVYCHTDVDGHVAGFVQWHVGKGLISACMGAYLEGCHHRKNHGLSWERSYRRGGTFSLDSPGQSLWQEHCCLRPSCTHLHVMSLLPRDAPQKTSAQSTDSEDKKKNMLFSFFGGTNLILWALSSLSTDWTQSMMVKAPNLIRLPENFPVLF